MRRRMQGMDVASSIYFGAFNRALIIIPTYMTFMYINHKNDAKVTSEIPKLP